PNRRHHGNAGPNAPSSHENADHQPPQSLGGDVTGSALGARVESGSPTGAQNPPGPLDATRSLARSPSGDRTGGSGGCATQSASEVDQRAKRSQSRFPNLLTRKCLGGNLKREF